MGLYVDGKLMAHLLPFPTPGSMTDVANPLVLPTKPGCCPAITPKFSLWKVKSAREKPTPTAWVRKEYGSGRQTHVLIQTLK